MRDRFHLRLVALGLAVFLAVALWRSFPGLGGLLDGRDSDAEPRAVIARGDLAADEIDQRQSLFYINLFASLLFDQRVSAIVRVLRHLLLFVLWLITLH